jgi:hypothetical protein
MRVVGLAAVVVAMVTAPLHGQESLEAVLARAAAYIAGYQRELAMVVAQERYTQEVRYPAPPMSRVRDVTATTELVSDFLLIRGPEGTWIPFRDVFERDGTPVRDRQERLSALFIDSAGSAFEQAGRIAEESARYNIGSINRTINVPTMALEFLTPEHRSRFDFEFERGLSSGVRVVRYTERRPPIYIRTTGNRSLPASGRYWIQEATGLIEQTELRAGDSALEAVITVTYRPDEPAGLWVPGRMEEEYLQKGDRSEIRGTAVYSRYRRFQVTTSDELAK